MSAGVRGHLVAATLAAAVLAFMAMINREIDNQNATTDEWVTVLPQVLFGIGAIKLLNIFKRQCCVLKAHAATRAAGAVFFTPGRNDQEC